MNTLLVDNEWLAATLPEGFEDIPHEELEKLMGFKYDCMWGTRDAARHMLICITWKDSNKLVTKLMSVKGFAQQVDKTFSKRYRKNGYQGGSYFQREVSGADAQAHGFGFSYTVDGVAQEGEVIVFKRGIRCYTLVYYTRSEFAQSNRATYDQIVASLEVK